MCEWLLYDTLFFGLKSFKTLSDSWWTKNRFIGEKKNKNQTFHSTLLSKAQMKASLGSGICCFSRFGGPKPRCEDTHHASRGREYLAQAAGLTPPKIIQWFTFRGVCFLQSLRMTNVVFKCWHSWRKGGMLTNRAVGNDNRRFTFTKTVSLTSLSGSWHKAKGLRQEWKEIKLTTGWTTQGFRSSTLSSSGHCVS